MSWWIGLCGLGAVLCSGGSAALLHGAETRSAAAWVVPVAVLWGAFALAAARLASKVDARQLPSGWTLALIVGIGAIIRIPLIGTPPLLSDDVFRYLWEGLAMNSGHNPFAEAPETITGLDDVLRGRVNHGSLTSIYPPLAMAWFRLLSGLGGTVAIAQGCTVLADLTIVASLVRYSRRAGHGIWPGILYAMHPLPTLESASGAHIDIVAIALATVACLNWIEGRQTSAILAAVAGFAVKLLPAVLLPALLRRSGRPGAAAFILGISGCLLLTLPFLAAGDGLVSSFALYTGTWSFNGFAFPILSVIAGGSARFILIAIGAGVGLWTIYKKLDPVASWFWIGSAFVLLSPTVHPWYVLWAMIPSLLMGSWGWAAAAIPLLGAYAVLGTLDSSGVWSEGVWLWVFTWPPALFVLVLERFRSTRRADSADLRNHSPPQTGPGMGPRPDNHWR